MSEEYSREAYDQAEQEIESAKKNISPDAPTEDLRAAVEQKATAEGRRDSLHEQSWDEALKANEEYDQLWVQKAVAEKAIADFRVANSILQAPTSEAEAVPESAERKEKSLEEQAAIYAEMSGVDATKILEIAQAHQAELSEEERNAFTLMIFKPEGKTTAQSWQDIEAQNPTYKYTDPEAITTEGETEEAEVVFARYGQEPDEDTLCENAKSAIDREATDTKWMSPKLRMIVGEFYRRAEGKQLDEKNVTQCPGSRTEDGRVPRLDFIAGSGEVDLSSSRPGFRFPRLGARQVV